MDICVDVQGYLCRCMRFTFHCKVALMDDRGVRGDRKGEGKSRNLSFFNRIFNSWS